MNNIEILYETGVVRMDAVPASDLAIVKQATGQDEFCGISAELTKTGYRVSCGTDDPHQSMDVGGLSAEFIALWFEANVAGYAWLEFNEDM